MKKKSNSLSAFFNPRVLVGLAVVLTGLCMALFAAEKPTTRGNLGFGPAADRSKASQRPGARRMVLAKSSSPGEYSSRRFLCRRKHWHCRWRLRYDRQDYRWRK